MESITKELREWWVRKFPVMDKELHKDFAAIADRIDEAHEALRDQLDTSERQKESYREDLLAANRQVHASYNDGFDDGFASADDWYVDHEAQLAEHGWVRLPVDADGVPIRVGDVMDGNRGTVTCIRDAGHGWEIVTDHMYSYNPDDLHHHAPTVEDLLREFALACEDAGNSRPAVMRLAEEYAAKLRLAGDE